MTLEELYEDMYSRLSGSEELSALIGENKIFDYTPYEDVKGPYVVIGDTHEVEGRLLDDEERKVFVRLHVWSSADGRKETITISRAVEKILSQDVNNYIFESVQILHDDEQWIHGILTFRTYIEKGVKDNG